MTDTEVQVEVQLSPNSPTQIQDLLEELTGVEEEDTVQELEEPLAELCAVAVSPPCGEQADCSSDCEAWAWREVRLMDDSLQSIQLQLQLLMSKTDGLHNRLVNGQDHLETEGFAAVVPTFLYTCQPYFTYLESTARSSAPQHIPLPFYIRSRLLDFSQQLCDRLEQLVLTYASYNLLSLDESEPDSVSHFYIGQCQIGRLRLTAFRYCRPTAYLARADTGLHKRMRWNVERLRDDQQQQQQQQQMDEEEEGETAESETETIGDTEYYFLCCEEVQTEADPDRHHGNTVRMWSIGQWVQMNPDPDTDDIYDWILCEVPQAEYVKLLCLGSEEPSTCSATDQLLGLLLGQHAAENDRSTGPHCTSDHLTL
ncbi:UPF0575 protein C19orf67 homolog [Centroberyx affinis]|uniref:UPF0575 protein C19orf67 homolog n=1 Tax=Centroberyx affinis TaxID=166261 RepID=UPI003A5C3A93